MPILPKADPAVRPWLWAGLFVLCGVAAFCIPSIVTGVPRSGAFVDYNLERLESYATAGRGESEGARRVILLGTSRLKYATWDGEEIGRLASQATGGPVQVMGIFNNDADFDDFVPLAEVMLEARPDAVLLQAELLAGAHFVPNLYRRIDKSVQFFRWWFFGFGPWQPDVETPWEVQNDRPCVTNFSEERYELRINYPQKIDVTGDSAASAENFIRKAVGQGVSIILVAVPKYPVVEKIRPSVPPTLEGSIERVTASSRQVELWRYPAEIPSDSYCDFLHMNEKGRKVYTDWITERIAELVSRRSFDLPSQSRL
jgi:hypothetical protein